MSSMQVQNDFTDFFTEIDSDFKDNSYKMIQMWSKDYSYDQQRIDWNNQMIQEFGDTDNYFSNSVKYWKEDQNMIQRKINNHKVYDC